MPFGKAETKISFNISVENFHAQLQELIFSKSSSHFNDHVLLIELIEQYEISNQKKSVLIYEKLFKQIIELRALNVEDIKKIFYKINEFANINQGDQLQFLNFLWKEGDVASYYAEASRALDELIILKNYESTQKLAFAIMEITPKWLKPVFISLFVSIATRSISEILVHADKVQFLLDSDWERLDKRKYSRKEYYMRLYRIFTDFETEDVECISYSLTLKLKIYHLFEVKTLAFTKEEVLKFYILNCTSSLKLSGLLPLIKTKETRAKLLEKIKPELKYSQVKNTFCKSAKFFQFKNTFTKQISNSEELLTHGPLNDYFLTNSGDEEQIFEKYLGKGNEDETHEFKLISRIRAGEFDDVEDKMGLFFSFRSMNYLKASKMLLKSKNINVSDLYLFCEILLLEKKYLECVSEIDEKVAKKILDDKLPIEFKYLKAEALSCLGRNAQAKTLYREIAVVNPDYRLVREKLKNV